MNAQSQVKKSLLTSQSLAARVRASLAARAKLAGVARAVVDVRAPFGATARVASRAAAARVPSFGGGDITWKRGKHGTLNVLRCHAKL